jgi:hypothetical protein
VALKPMAAACGCPKVGSRPMASVEVFLPLDRQAEVLRHPSCFAVFWRCRWSVGRGTRR